MFFPLGDDNSRVRSTPWVVYGLLLACAAAWIRQLWIGESFTYGFSAIPFEIMHGQDLIATTTVLSGGHAIEIPQYPGPKPIQLTLVTSMFLHGSWAHLLGNLLYLWIFGDQIEDLLGRVRFLGFYLVCGIAGAMAQIVGHGESVIPTLGASGAIAGVLGAYIAKFPGNSVKVLFLFQIIRLPALLVLGLWFVVQITSQVGLQKGAQGGVAYMAHIGGFATGFFWVQFLKPSRNKSWRAR